MKTGEEHPILIGGVSENAHVIAEVVNRMGVCSHSEAKKIARMGQSAFGTALRELLDRKYLSGVQVGRCHVLSLYCPEAEEWIPQAFALKTPSHLSLYRAIACVNLAETSTLMEVARSDWKWTSNQFRRRLEALVRADLVQIVHTALNPNRRMVRALAYHPKVENVLGRVDSLRTFVPRAVEDPNNNSRETLLTSVLAFEPDLC